MRPWQHRTEAPSGRLSDGTYPVRYIGRKVDGHVPANEERVEKHLFSALTCSRKRAELIGEPRHPSQAVETRGERRVDSAEEITPAKPQNSWLCVTCSGEPREALVYLGLLASLIYTSYVIYRIALHKTERPPADGTGNFRRQEAVFAFTGTYRLGICTQGGVYIFITAERGKYPHSIEK